MRKNTEQCLNAFVSGREYHGDRDRITVSKNGTIAWELHGNMIAKAFWSDGVHLCLSTCGWDTNTTWDRLRAIANHYGIALERKSFSSGTFTLTSKGVNHV